MKQPNEAARFWQESGIEPSLEDMLADPLIRLVMQCDGISKADVEDVIDQTRARLMAIEEPVQPQARRLEYCVYP